MEQSQLLTAGAELELNQKQETGGLPPAEAHAHPDPKKDGRRSRTRRAAGPENEGESEMPKHGFRRRPGEDTETFFARIWRETAERDKEQSREHEKKRLFGGVASLRIPVPDGVEDFQKGSAAVSRTLVRRELDYYRKYEEQVRRGRPDKTWQQCNNPSCSRCFYVELLLIPRNRTAYGQGKSVAGRARLFIDAMMRHFYKTRYPAEMKKKERRLIESFVCSPIVKGAMGQFDYLCRVHRLEPSSKTLALVLTSIRSSVKHLVSAIQDRKLIEAAHELLTNDGTLYSRNCGLEDIALRFCAQVESWRRYGIERGAEWEFGSDEAMTDFLGALLMDFHVMKRHGAVQVRRLKAPRLNHLWEAWLDEYHLFSSWAEQSQKRGPVAVQDLTEVAQEANCLAGFGQGETPWVSARMKQCSA